MIGVDIRKSSGVLQREHIAVDEIQVAAVLCRDAVEVFQLSDVICGHPAVLAADGVPVHAALVIAAEQTFQIELHEIHAFFVLGQKRPLNGLLPADDQGSRVYFTNSSDCCSILGNR